MKKPALEAGFFLLQSAITSSRRPLQEPERPEQQPVPEPRRERPQESLRPRPEPAQQRLWQHQPQVQVPALQVSEQAPTEQAERRREPASALLYHRRRA